MSIITYELNHNIQPEDLHDIYIRSGLKRPTDLRCLTNMIKNANVLITAWDGSKLIGILRAMTDFSFDCYLNDLAVDVNYQRRGIGRELVNRLKDELEDNALILLISSASALSFYGKLGFLDDTGPYGRTLCMPVRRMEQ